MEILPYKSYQQLLLSNLSGVQRGKYAVFPESPPLQARTGHLTYGKFPNTSASCKPELVGYRFTARNTPNRSLLRGLQGDKDLMSVGNEALMRALRNCVIENLGERGFGDYAGPYIRGAIIEEAFRITYQIFIPPDRRVQIRAVMQAEDYYLNLGIQNPTTKQLADYLHLDPQEVEDRLADLALYSVQSYQVQAQNELDEPSENQNEPEDTVGKGTEDQVTTAELNAFLAETVRRPRWLQALKMHIYDDDTLTEVAQALNVGPTRASEIVERALRRLRQSTRFRRYVQEE